MQTLDERSRCYATSEPVARRVLSPARDLRETKGRVRERNPPLCGRMRLTIDEVGL